MDQIPEMENLSPHKKFEGLPTIKPKFRPFYIHKRPKDLPSECQNCGSKFYVGMNLEIGRNRLGRFLRKAVFPSFLLSLASPFIIGYFFPDLFNRFGDKRTWQLIWAMMFFPPILVWILSLSTPITRHVECLKCDWSQDFPSLKASRKKREQEADSET